MTCFLRSPNKYTPSQLQGSGHRRIGDSYRPVAELSVLLVELFIDMSKQYIEHKTGKKYKKKTGILIQTSNTNWRHTNRYYIYFHVKILWALQNPKREDYMINKDSQILIRTMFLVSITILDVSEYDSVSKENI